MGDMMGDYVKQTEDAGIKSPVRVWTLDDKTTALIYLARYHGRASIAAKALAEERGMEIAVSTLNEWKHGEEFEHVSRTFAARLEDELIREARENAHAAAAVERQALEKMEELLDGDRIRIGDVTSAAQAATQMKVKNIEKVLLMTGRPQVITERRDFGNIVDSLLQKGILKLDAPVDSTAEETS